MSNSFTNQVLAQIELFAKPENYPLGVYTRCPSTSTRPWSTASGSAGRSTTELISSRPPMSMSADRTSPITTGIR